MRKKLGEIISQLSLFDFDFNFGNKNSDPNLNPAINFDIDPDVDHDPFPPKSLPKKQVRRQVNLSQAKVKVTPIRKAEPQPAPIKIFPSFSKNSFQDLCVNEFSAIEVVLKKRMVESWRVTWNRSRLEEEINLRVEVPELLDAAPLEIKMALLNWALLVAQGSKNRRPRKHAGAKNVEANSSKVKRAELENSIRNFLRNPEGEAKASLAHRRVLKKYQSKLNRSQSQGRFHDLNLSFNRVNEKYFQGNLQATVTWSARLGGLSTHHLTKDGAGKPTHLISISRGYDNLEVTPEILDGVMYLECLHIIIPPTSTEGRRMVHGPDFRRREKEYAHFETWMHWHRHRLGKMLTKMAREESVSKLKSKSIGSSMEKSGSFLGRLFKF